MSEHLLELLLEYRSHSSSFVRQSILCGITIVLSSLTYRPASIAEWLQGAHYMINYYNIINHYCYRCDDE